jgi:hypothetical protein
MQNLRNKLIAGGAVLILAAIAAAAPAAITATAIGDFIY